MEAEDVVCHKSNVKQLYQSQNSKTHALNIRLYVATLLLLDNLEVSFNFSLTFLQLNVIKMFTVL